MKKLLFGLIILSLFGCSVDGVIKTDAKLSSETSSNKETSSKEEVKLKDVLVSKVQIISTDNLVVSEGAKVQVSGNVIYEDDTRDSAIEWSSSDNTILSVNSTTGDISGIKSGLATIVATSLKDKSKKDTLTVTVKKADVFEAITRVTPKESTLKVGETIQLQASIQMSDGKVSPNVVWKSANSSVALVTNGLVTAVGEGKTTITAVASGDSTKTAAATITVVGEDALIEKTPETSTIESNISAK